MRVVWCRTDPWLAMPAVAECFCEHEGILTRDFFRAEDLVPHAAGRFLLRVGFWQYSPGRPFPPLRRVSGGGKPRFSGGQPFFSISHAGSVAVCAFSERETGADVEQIAPVEPSLLSVLQPEELAYLRRFPDSGQTEAFYQLWTQKESLVKARGGTLADILEQESVITPDLLWKDRLNGFFLRRLPFPEPGYVLSVSTETESPAVIARIELPRSIPRLLETLHWNDA